MTFMLSAYLSHISQVYRATSADRTSFTPPLTFLNTYETEGSIRFLSLLLYAPAAVSSLVHLLALLV